MQRTKILLAVLATALGLTSAGLPAATETLTLAWDMNPEPEVVGYVVHIGTEPGVYTEHVDVRNTTTYVLTTADAGQRYCFAVSAYFAGPVESPRSGEVCTNGNQAPTLANPGAQNHPLGQAVSVALSATDPEGARLTFSATGLPTGVTIASATGIMSGTPSQAGTFNVRASASDGVFSASQDFTWGIVSNPPAAPTLVKPTGAIATASPTFEWQAVATATRYRLWVDDASSVNPRVQVDLTPAEAGCAAGGAVCRSTPAVAFAAGAASWSVRASNQAGDGPWSGAMDFSVQDGRAPVIAIATPTSATSFSTGASTLAIGGTASDDVAVAQVTWASDRGGAGTAAGTSTWTVASIPLQAGANVITVTARDAQNNVSTDVLTVTKSDGQAPTIEISLPTSGPSHSTSSPSLALGGVARDEYGVTEVRWANNRGGSGLANGSSNWGVPAVPLLPGANVITVTARDAAGQTGTAQLSVTLTDSTAPTVAIVSPTSAASHSSTASSIGLAGTATDAFGVTQVTWANSRGGAGTASGTSGWSVSSIALQPGDNVITVTARDAAGLTGTATLTVALTDGAAPTVTISTPTTSSSHSTGQGTISLAGTAEDAFGVASVSWTNDRGGSGAASGTTSWNVPNAALQPGVNTFTITARDAAGRTGTDVIAVTRTDNEPPTVAIVTPTTAATHSTGSLSLALSGTASDAFGIAQITWANNRGGNGTATGTTAWSVAGVTLKSGENVITVTARDNGGSTATDVLTVTVTDGTAPAISIVSPTSGGTHSTTGSTIAVAGTASDAFGVTQVSWANSRGGSGTASGTTSWTAGSVALKPGDNVITVTAHDAAGLTGTATLTVALTDGVAPTVTIATPTTSSSHSTGLGTISLAGTAEDAFGVVSVSWANDRGGSGAASGTSSWSVPNTALQPGVNTFTITARDAAGRTGTDVIAVTRTDNEPPTVAIATPTAAAVHSTGISALSLGGTASDAFGIAQVTWANNRGGNGAASGTTSWSVSGLVLKPGENVITVTAKDTSGGTATDVLTVTLTDQENPTITISAPTDGSSYSTANATVAVGGAAADAFGVTDVRWTSDKGASGMASGTTSWTVPSVALSPGANVITVTARDAAGRTASDTVTVTRTDNEAPSLSIASPTANPTHATTTRTVNLAGAASDTFGVSQVSWASDRGGSGVATGTTAWTIPAVALQLGANVITVSARDAAGNTARKVLTVTMSDGDAPTIRIVAPTQAATFPTTVPTIAVTGSAADEIGVARVTWTTSQGGSGTASGTTEWSIPALALKPGVNVLTVTAADAAGNTSKATLSITATDSQRPVIAIASPTVDPRFVTTQGAVSVSGTARDDFGAVSVTWANDRGGSGSASGSTTWSIPNLSLQPGPNLITVTATDAAGNVATDVVTVRSDSRRPTVAINQPVSTATHAANASTLDLAGVANDEEGVTEVSWSSDRGGRGVAAGTNAWRAAAVPLVNGINTITVTARDEAGNSATAVLTVVRDTRAPGVTIEGPTNAPSVAVNAGVVNLRGTANDDLGVTQVTWTSDRGGSGAAQGATAWTAASIPLLAGRNLITVTARDAAGNTASDSIAVVLDTRAPVIAIAAPTAAGAFTTTGNNVAIAGSADDESTITEVSWTNSRGGSGVASGSSRWSIDRVGLRAGINDLTITARDAAGNTASTRLRVTATDGQSPRITINGPSPGGSFSTSMRVVNIDGTAADDFEVAQVAWASDRGVSGVARGTDRWIAGGVALQPGVNVIAVTAVDGAGRTATDVLRITVDSQLPAVSITAPASGSTYTSSSSTVVLTGVASDDAGITQVAWLSDRGPSGMAMGTSTWATPPVRLEQGPNVFTVTARDGSGNVATATLTVVYADTVAPTLSVASSRLANGSSSLATTSYIAFTGTAQDAVGVTQVTWSNDRGGSGTASGAAVWNTGNIPLAAGENLITITARDAAGNVATARVPVTRPGQAPTQAPVATAAAAPAPTNQPSSPAASQPSPATQQPPAGPPSSPGMPVWLPNPAPAYTAGPTDRNGVAPPSNDAFGAPERTLLPSRDDTDQQNQQVPDSEPPTPPVLTISTPAMDRHVTSDDAVTVAGTARDTSGIVQVTWSTDSGASGVASGLDRWAIRGLKVPVGTTVLTVTARNTTGDLTSATVTIIRQASTRLTIEGPSSAAYWTSAASSVALRGSASDNVVRVTWAADWGGSGTASGTRQWTIPTIGLQRGVNRITVRAYDRAGGVVERVVTVAYSPRVAAAR